MGTLTENIPRELAELTRWVGAHEDSKCPMKVFDRKRASVSRAETWGTFQQACRCITRGVYNYCGFVFANDGYVGIDVDCAFDDDGFLTDDALEAIDACKSYTEVSKSGKGIHIICKGELPFKGRNNRNGWEIYKDARYFLLTGRVISYSDVVIAQEGIDLVLRKHFSEVEPASSNNQSGQKIFAPIWEPPTYRGVRIGPEYPVITSGARHLSMVSLCGQLHNVELTPETMLTLALDANRRYMSPPLPDDEIEQIVRSVSRYKR